MPSILPPTTGFDMIQIIEAALATDSLDDLFDVTLSRLLHCRGVRQTRIYLFNQNNDLVLAASACKKGPRGIAQENIRVQSWNIDSTRRYSTRLDAIPMPFLQYMIPLIQSDRLLGFMNVHLDRIPENANDLNHRLHLIGLQLSTKIEALGLQEALRESHSAHRNAMDENLRHQQRISALSKELYAICAISAKINQSMDLKKSLCKSIVKIKEVFRAAGVIVYLKRGGRGSGKQSISIEDAPINTLLRDRISNTVEQLFGAAARPGAKSCHPQQVSLEGGGIGSMVAAPMIFKKNIIGTLVIVLESAGLYSQENLRLLSGVTSIMAMAIENMNLYRKGQQKKKEAAFLVHSILKFNQKLNLEQTLKSIAEKGAEFIGRQCLVYLISETKLPLIRHKRRKGKGRDASHTIVFHRIQPDALQHFSRRMMHRKKAFLIDDIDRSRKMNPALQSHLAQEGVHSMIAVPLNLAARPVGMLLLCSCSAGQPFEYQELEVAGAFGAAAAVSIENARAYHASMEMSGFLEKKISEKTSQIQHIQERQKIMVENRKDIIFRVNRENRFVFVNKAMENLTGCSREDLYRQGVGVDEIVAPEDRDRVRSGFRRILNRELPMIKDLEYRHLNRGGEDHFVSLTIYPETDLSGRIVGVEGVGHDVSEKKKLEAELEKTKDLALLGEFSSAIAHQIRNPLSNILMGTALLQRAAGLAARVSDSRMPYPLGLSHVLPDRENLAEIFKNLTDGIYNLNQVVTELAEYTKTLKLRRTCQRIDIILDETLALLHGLIVQNRIRIDKFFDTTLAPLPVDAVLIGQAFQNIIHNAIQAMPSGGDLLIWARSYSQNPSQALVSICDTGPGIEPEDTEKIFRPFFTTKDSGTGLGLSLAHRIIEAHGGKIWACRNPCPHRLAEFSGSEGRLPPEVVQGITFHALLPMDKGEIL